MRSCKKLFSIVAILVLCLSFAPRVGAVKPLISTRKNIVSASRTYSTAVMADGSLWMWGDEPNFPQVSSGIYAEETVHSDIPVKIMNDVSSVYCSDECVAVIKTDDSLWFFGTNSATAQSAQLSQLPVKIAEDVLSCQVVYSSGIQHSFLFLKKDHSLWNARKLHGSEAVIEKIMDDVISASTIHVWPANCNEDGFAVVKTDGSLWMWGRGYYADGNEETYHSEPVKVMDGVLSISTGGYPTTSVYAVVKEDHTLWTWGMNGGYGSLGNGSKDEIAKYPQKIMDNVVYAEYGYKADTGAAIQADGSLWLWGENNTYQIGNGQGGLIWYPSHNEAVCQLTPTKVLDDVIDVSCGKDFAIAARADGSIWTWGNNLCKALGNGSTGNQRDVIWGIESIAQNVPAKIMDGTIRVDADGASVSWADANPFINENGRTMVPLRAVGDALGLAVDWDANRHEASFSRGDKTIRFQIGNTSAQTSDGNEIIMDTAAVIVNNRIYAPIRYLAEYFGYTVHWDAVNRTVIIE